jgi:hypothetical protein
VGGLLSYESLPESLKKECLVRTKVEIDPDELHARQELVKQKKPSELAEMRSLADLPLPQKIESLVRPKKRTLKSIKDKDLLKKKR